MRLRALQRRSTHRISLRNMLVRRDLRHCVCRHMYQNADGLYDKVWTTIPKSVFCASRARIPEFASRLTNLAEVGCW